MTVSDIILLVAVVVGAFGGPLLFEHLRQNKLDRLQQERFDREDERWRKELNGELH